jgi:Tfp pilus assembly protein PilZ
MLARKSKVERKYQRLNTAVKIIYGVMAKMHRPFSSLSNNVGGGGICIPLERNLKKGEVLELEIELPGKDRPIFALGRVAWVKKAKGGAKKTVKYCPYQGGIEFIAIEQEEREKILKFAS